MADWSPLLRIARRTIMKNKRRSALVVALIALTVGAGVFAATAHRTTRITDLDRVNASMGKADLSIVWSGTPERGILAEVRQFDPSAVITTHHTYWLGGRWDRTITSIDLDAPITDGILDLHAGRPPRATGEAAISTELMHMLDLSLGARAELPLLDGEWTIIGEVRQPTSRRRQTIVLTEADLLASAVPGVLQTKSLIMTDLRDAPQTARLYNEAISARGDIYVEARSDQMRYRAYDRAGSINLNAPGQLSTAVSAFLMLEVAFVAAAAFAVGTRRRIVEFGLLATVGADPGHLRRLVLVEAVLLAVIGALIGAVAGFGTAAMASRNGWLDFVTEGWGDGLNWSFSDIFGPVVIGICAALLAAWLPAWRVGRISATTALAGRIPQAQLPRRLVVIGLLAVAFGASVLVAGRSVDARTDGQAVLVVMAVVTMVVGAAACAAPIMTAIGGMADRFSANARLVARDSGRQQVRAGATVAALLVVVAIPVVAGTIVESDESIERDRGYLDPHFVVSRAMVPLWDYEPGALAWAEQELGPNAVAQVQDPELRAEFQSAAEAAVRSQLDIVDIVEVPIIPRVRVAGRDFGYGIVDALVATPELLVFLNVSPAVRESIDRNEVVVSSSFILGFVVDGQVELELPTAGGARRIEVGPKLRSGLDGWPLPPLLIPPRLASELGSAGAFSLQIYRATTAPTLEELEQLHTSLSDAQYSIWDDPRITDFIDFGSVSVGSAPSGLTGQQVVNRITLGAMVIALLIALASSALSAVELDRELGTMVAAGAPPAIRRRFLGLQSAYHVFVAAVLGTPLAVLFVWAIFQTGTETDIDAAWLAYGISLAVMPVVVGAAIALVFRSGRPVVSRRLS